MNAAFPYLLLMRLKNQIKSIVHTPAKLIYALVMLGLLAFIAFTGQKGAADTGEFGDIRELSAMMTALFVVMFIMSANSGFSSGTTLFKMPDVNFLFAGPFKPSTVLFYGIFQQLGTSLLWGFFILFQYSWMHASYGITYGMMLLIVVGYGLNAFTAQFVAMLIYSATSSNSKRKQMVQTVCMAIVALYAVWLFGVAIFDKANMWANLTQAATSLPARLFPVAGWLGGAIGSIFIGDMLGAVLGIGIWVVALVAIVIVVQRLEPDYYEDVLQNTERIFQAQSAAKAGRTSEAAPKKLRMGQMGLGGGFGASAFYYKHKLENRRSKIFVLASAELVFAVMSIGFGYFMKEEGIVPILAFAVYMQIFSVALGRLVKEMTRPYVFLVPESPFKKLLWCLVERFPSFLLQAVIIFVPVCLFVGEGVPTMVAAVAAHMSFGLLFTAGNLVTERVFGRVAAKSLIFMFYFIVLIVFIVPGITLAIVLNTIGVTLFNSSVTICLALAAGNLLCAILGIFLCRNLLQYAELN